MVWENFAEWHVETCNEKKHHFGQPFPSNNAELTGQKKSIPEAQCSRTLSATFTTQKYIVYTC